MCIRDSHSIDLINEDDAGHGLFCLVEEVAHTGCADADVHLDEVRAGDLSLIHIYVDKYIESYDAANPDAPMTYDYTSLKETIPR